MSAPVIGPFFSGPWTKFEDDALARRGEVMTSCPVCDHLHDEQDPCRVDQCFCLSCLTCHGHGVIPAGGHDRRGEELERQCPSCDGRGQR